MTLYLAVLSGGVGSSAGGRLGATDLPHLPDLPPLPARVQSLPMEAGRGRGRPAALLCWLEEVRGQARPGPGPGGAAGRPGTVVVAVVGLVLVGVGLGSLEGFTF